MLQPAAISIPALRIEQAERTSDFLEKVPLLRSVSDSLASAIFSPPLYGIRNLVGRVRATGRQQDSQDQNHCFHRMTTETGRGTGLDGFYCK